MTGNGGGLGEWTGKAELPWPTHSADDPALAVLAHRVSRPRWQRMLSWLVWPWRQPKTVYEVKWLP